MKVYRIRYLFVLIVLLINPVKAQHSLVVEYAEIVQTERPTPQQIDTALQFIRLNFFRSYVISDSLIRDLITKSTTTNYQPGWVGGYALSAVILEKMGDLSEAERFANKAIDEVKTNTTIKYAPLAYYAMGTVYRRQLRKHDALAQFYNCLNVAEQLADSSMMRAGFTSIAIMYVGETNYDKALEYHRKAETISKDMRDWSALQRSYTNIGIVHLRKKAYDSAMHYHSRALALAEEFHDETQVAFSLNDLGSTYLSKGDAEHAIPYLKRSIDIRERIGEKDELSYTYAYMAQVYKNLVQENGAKYWAKKSLAIAKAIGNVKQTHEALELQSNIYAAFSRYDSAYAALHNFINYRDSVRQFENVEAMNELNAKYETEKKERALIETNLKVQQRNNQLIWVVGLLVLVAGVALVIYRNQKIKQQRLQLKAELAEAQTRNAIQEERLRISQELHDNIGSQLTFVNASIETLEKSENDSRFADIRKLTTSAIHELRKTVWLINKQSATVEEFVIKLREYIPANSIPPIQLSASGNLQLEIQATIANQLFRVVQEAVNNSIKHAHATYIQVSLAVTDKVLSVQITDNGIGFETSVPTSGFGLRNIEKRIKSVNGTISIQSKPTETSIALSIPL